MSRVLASAVCSVAAVLILGCGGDSGSATTGGGSGASPASDEAALDAEAAGLLNSWVKQMVPPLLLLKKRADAQARGDIGVALKAERAMLRGLAVVEGFGRDGRKAFVDEFTDGDPPPVVAATVDAGDGLSRWAHEIRTAPGPINYRAAQRIADLGAEAMGLLQEAYEEAGVPIPPALRDVP